MAVAGLSFRVKVMVDSSLLSDQHSVIVMQLPRRCLRFSQRCTFLTEAGCHYFRFWLRWIEVLNKGYHTESSALCIGTTFLNIPTLLIKLEKVASCPISNKQHKNLVSTCVLLSVLYHVAGQGNELQEELQAV